jgi:hypothetical protein
VGGGRKSKVSEAIDSSLYSRGWAEKQFATEIVIDGSHTETPTHQIDCFKNRIALEIEWNNKDPFFDRDLNNFRLLFELRAVCPFTLKIERDDETFPRGSWRAAPPRRRSPLRTPCSPIRRGSSRTAPARWRRNTSG